MFIGNVIPIIAFLLMSYNKRAWEKSVHFEVLSTIEVAFKSLLEGC